MIINISSQTFNQTEMLAVVGLAQSVLILVYIVSRMRSFSQAAAAIGYFFFLSAAFVLQFAEVRLPDIDENIKLSLWFVVTNLPPLGFLLIMQIAKKITVFSLRHILALAAAPAVLLLAVLIASSFDVCSATLLSCDRFFDVLYWFSGMIGGLTVLAVFADRSILKNLWIEKSGREKYWLVITLISATILVSGLYILRSTGSIIDENADFIALLLHIVFAYLLTTTLFRVYPAALQLSAVPRLGFLHLSAEEQAIAEKARHLMNVEKVYQELSYSRADMAKEMGISESVLSRIINISFGKSFPRLMAEYRVEDAKVMLQNPDIPVQTVAVESGFNSVATFNRVFKEMTGETPSSYRQRHISG